MDGTNHPKELVNIIRGVSSKATEDDEHIINIKLSHNTNSHTFVRGKGGTDLRQSNFWSKMRPTTELSSNAAYCTNMRIIPCIVIYYNRSVGHGSQLIAVVPPGHDASVRRGVHVEPPVSFAEIIENKAATVSLASSQDDRW